MSSLTPVRTALRRAAPFIVPLGLMALPFIAGAVTLDVGLNYATASGLGTRDIRETIATIIKVFMGLLGTVAVVIILLGGFQWMVAGGNEEKVEKAKKLLIAGIIGLAIILTAYSITNFIVGNLVNAT